MELIINLNYKKNQAIKCEKSRFKRNFLQNYPKLRENISEWS